ncbi:MAG TPA: efflux RND transporter permease subunit, partial [Longimicrobiaceae bacterium]|nr:efflux RND transporter permease subunit [Longimicrobiaceae bacterium]
AVDLLPDIAFPRLVVYTGAAGAAPAEVERFVSEPVEQAVATVAGAQEVESISREGVSLVVVRFAWGTDMDFAALGVRERLDGVAEVLPELATRPTVLRLDPKSEPILALSVAGEGVATEELKELAEQVLRRRLEQIDGVARAAVTGGREREIHVEVDPRRMEAYGLTLAEVTGALEAANARAPGGTVRQGRYRYALRTLGELQSVDEIARVPLERRRTAASARDSVSAAALTLADIATVSDGWRERESIARYNGREAIGLLVFKDAGSNTVRVAERVEGVLEELRAQYPALSIDVAMSQAGFVRAAIDSVVENLIQGALLAFLVLLLFLRDVRYPLAIGLAIPISVVATFVLLDAAGVSLNLMSLGGLALGVGMLVDNSIVVLENTFRHRADGMPPAEAAERGASEVQGAITASTLTTIAVFGPIVYIEGVAGELFGALSFAVAFSLLASLIVALTLLPTMAARWKVVASSPESRTPKRSGPLARLLERFERGFEHFASTYERALEAALARPGRVVALAALLLVAGLAVGALLERRVLPPVDQGEFRARLELPRGTPLEETEAAARRVEAALLDDPAVEAVFTSVGRRVAAAGVEEEESGLNTAVLEVRLKEGERTAPVLERLRPHFGALPAGALTVEAGEATALGRLMGGGDADLAVRIRGDDLGAALAYAQTLEQRLAARPELANARVGT